MVSFTQLELLLTEKEREVTKLLTVILLLMWRGSSMQLLHQEKEMKKEILWWFQVQRHLHFCQHILPLKLKRKITFWKNVIIWTKQLYDQDLLWTKNIEVGLFPYLMALTSCIDLINSKEKSFLQQNALTPCSQLSRHNLIQLGITLLKESLA